MHVFGRREGGHRAVPPTCQHDGNLPLEVQLPFQDTGNSAEVTKGLRRVLRGANERLPLSVIPEATGLEQGRHADCFNGPGDIGRLQHPRERRRAEACAREEALFGDAILGDGDRRRGGAHPHPGGEALQRRCRDILEFRGDGRALIGELVEGRGVVVRGNDLVIGHLAGGTTGIRLQHHDTVAHDARPEREHAPELPATQHAQCGAGQDQVGSGSERPRTRAVCASRRAASRFARAVSPRARIAAA
jgi:hypothetical protein